MRALVTGHAGFIGRHMVAALRARGYDVLGVDVVTAGDRRSQTKVVITDVANIAAHTANECMYFRAGRTVHVSGSVGIDS